MLGIATRATDDTDLDAREERVSAETSAALSGLMEETDWDWRQGRIGRPMLDAAYEEINALFMEATEPGPAQSECDRCFAVFGCCDGSCYEHDTTD